MIGKESLVMYPYQSIVLQPRSETIVRAVTNCNQVSIVESKKTQAGVFIGCCLVQPKKNSCPVSILNITEGAVEIKTPCVEIEELAEESETEDAVMNLSMEEAGLTRSERVKKALRMEHLNREEKSILLKICETYNDIFQIFVRKTVKQENAVKHKIRVKTDTASINIRLYRLPEKHKEEVDRQIQEMLDNNILRRSKSEWNAPLLVVPKKLDASGVRKLRMVVDFR